MNSYREGWQVLLQQLEQRTAFAEAMGGPDKVDRQRKRGRLTARERISFSLRHFEGMSIREIAGVMKVPDGSVKNNLFRAVRKLRVALAPALGVRQ